MKMMVFLLAMVASGCGANAPAASADMVSAPCPPDGGEKNDAGKCTTPACNDGVRNGAETDVDCGGGECPGCDETRQCLRKGDCLPRFDCSNNHCSQPRP